MDLKLSKSRTQKSLIWNIPALSTQDHSFAEAEFNAVPLYIPFYLFYSPLFSQILNLHLVFSWDNASAITILISHSRDRIEASHCLWHYRALFTEIINFAKELNQLRHNADVVQLDETIPHPWVLLPQHPTVGQHHKWIKNFRGILSMQALRPLSKHRRIIPPSILAVARHMHTSVTKKAYQRWERISSVTVFFQLLYKLNTFLIYNCLFAH